jgi:leader peptidase (prepilin peptidase) / N-methyltransferase
VTPPWIAAAAAAGLIAGPRIRASVFFRAVGHGQLRRRACPACARDILPGRRRPWPLLPVSGRCPFCRARIGPPPLAAEVVTALVLAALAARAASALECAALAWLAVLAIPLAFIDAAVHRLPDPLTALAFGGTFALLSAAALAGHQPGALGRAALGAAALAGFYLLLFVIRPAGMGLGDAKLAASVGAALGWASWHALVTGAAAAFVLAACYGAALLATHRAARSDHLPLGPFIVVGALAAIVV